MKVDNECHGAGSTPLLHNWVPYGKDGYSVFMCTHCNYYVCHVPGRWQNMSASWTESYEGGFDINRLIEEVDVYNVVEG
jgi:hypothetical protein